MGGASEDGRKDIRKNTISFLTEIDSQGYADGYINSCIRGFY